MTRCQQDRWARPSPKNRPLTQSPTFPFLPRAPEALAGHDRNISGRAVDAMSMARVLVSYDDEKHSVMCLPANHREATISSLQCTATTKLKSKIRATDLRRNVRSTARHDAHEHIPQTKCAAISCADAWQRDSGSSGHLLSTSHWHAPLCRGVSLSLTRQMIWPSLPAT